MDLKQRLKKRKPEIYLVLILIFALSLRLYFFVGLNLNDDLCYVNLAHDILIGKYHPSYWIFSVRHMMHFPIAFFFFVFGISDFSAAFYILLCSLGGITIAFYIGKILFDEKAGLLAAFLLSIFPVDIAYATTIVPDIPVAFFMGLSVCLFLAGEKKDKSIYYILSGISIGLAWLVKSLAILIILFFAVYFLLDKIFRFKPLLSGKKTNSFKILQIRKAFLFVALGFVAVLFLEGIVYQITNNDFLLRFHSEAGHYTSTLAGVNRNLNYYPNTLLNKNSLYFNFFGYFFYFAILSTLYIILRWKKKAFILLAWFFPVLIYMQYGTMNPFEYVLIQRIWRFLNILTIPTVLIIAYFLTQNKLPLKRILLVTSVLFLTVTSIFYAYKITEYMNGAMLDFRETAKFLQKQPMKDIYADYDTIGKLDFLLKYERSRYLKNLASVKTPEEIKDSFVVVDASRGFVELPNLRSTLPKFLWNPPPNWQKVKVVNESNIGFYKTYDTKIYYVS